MIEIVIDGFCQPMQAPQGVIAPPLPPSMRNRHFVRMYKPQEIAKWQLFAKHEAVKQMKDRTPFKGMLSVVINVYLAVPKYLSKQKTRWALSGTLRPVTRPDCDNYSKSICDSMTGVLWLDDAQIVSLCVQKWYGQKPCVMIVVNELPAPWKEPEERTLFEEGVE
jgi:Holliday junction resolvase RusA-like endonuclease